jgi:hypothetical protein
LLLLKDRQPANAIGSNTASRARRIDWFLQWPTPPYKAAR